MAKSVRSRLSHGSSARRLNAGFLYVAPAALLLLLMTLYPVYKTLDMSVHKLNRATGENTFVGLANYESVVGDPVFRQALRQSIVFATGCAVGHIVIGFLLALVMNSRIDRRVLNLCRSAILLPWVLSSAVVAILLQLWAHPLISPIAKVLQSLGWEGQFQPLASSDTALLFLIAVNVWQYAPFYMLMIMTGMQSIDEELHWAAMVDGANYYQRVVHITWPHVRNVVLTFALFSLVVNLAYFDLVWIATQGGPARSTEVLATYAYRLAFASLNWNKASVVGIVLILISAFYSAVFMYLIRRR